MSDEWAKTLVEADIDEFKRLVEFADVEDVDEPTGRKEVEIAWTDDDGFHVEDGEAYGVYIEDRTVYHVDWTDGTRTTVTAEQLGTLDEGDWYTED